jgi:hypothetical protein
MSSIFVGFFRRKTFNSNHLHPAGLESVTLRSEVTCYMSTTVSPEILVSRFGGFEHRAESDYCAKKARRAAFFDDACGLRISVATCMTSLFRDTVEVLAVWDRMH